MKEVLKNLPSIVSEKDAHLLRLFWPEGARLSFDQRNSLRFLQLQLYGLVQAEFIDGQTYVFLTPDGRRAAGIRLN